MNKVINGNKKLLAIVFCGFIIRIFFALFGAEYYFGKEKFYIGGDTFWWTKTIINLLEHGSYTNALDNEWGYFTRTPGYSFFIGIFYLIGGKNIDIAFKLIVGLQIILDTISVFLIYKIGKKIFDNNSGLLAAFIYSIYPFIIVWTAIVYAESLSVFLFLLSIHLFLNAEKPKQHFISGSIYSLAVLTRIQLIVFIPFFILISLKKSGKKYLNIYSYNNTIFFILSIAIVYGSWPLRNIVLHGKPIFAQHLGDRAHWSPDYIYYMNYIWSVKTDHEPQLSQILNGEAVKFPPASYVHAEDSVSLLRVVELARNCGEGFSYFARSIALRDTVVKHGEDCNNEIVEIFKTLIANQKKYNKLNYYLIVPLNNLKKAVFKFNLYKPTSKSMAFIANVFFGFRTLLVLAGFASLIYIFFIDRSLFFSSGILIIIGYSVTWYFFQSFVYRNMEIRYLLHADILLLLPAAYTINKIHFFIKPTFLSK